MRKFITAAVSAVFVMATGVSAALNAAVYPSEEEKAGASTYIDPASLTPAQAASDESALSRQKSGFTTEERLTGEYNYIVTFSEPPLATYRGGIKGLAPTAPEIAKDARGAGQKRPPKLDAQSANSRAYLSYLEQRHLALEQQIGKRLNRAPRVIHRYKAALNAITVRMTQDEARKLAGMKDITHIERDYLAKPDTERGPLFIGAEPVWDGSGTGLPGAQGEGVIVGIIDSGINGQHPSFADIGADGYDHTNPNGPGTYFGECFSTPDLVCNDKLIGRYLFLDAQPGAGSSSEDVDGHGSHVASTAAGNVLNDAPLFNAEGNASGVTLGRISGVAPHANIIAYRVCAPNCASSDSIKAIDQAILDGVDVLNESISGASGSPWNSSKAMAFLNARAAGISVAKSAGNSGPTAGTAATAVNAPWHAGVAALTHDRDVPVKTLSDFSGGLTPPANIAGRAITPGYGPARIVYAGNFSNGNANPGQCLTAFPAGTWTNGEIVVCDRGTIARTQKCINVRNGGAAGCVLANITGFSDIFDEVHVIPAIHISTADGNALKTWLASGTGHMATIGPSGAWSSDPTRGDIMAAFSSRGPYTGFDFLAPNVAAPGVGIYAAYRSPEQYGFLSGTSMASPHVAGAMALLKQVTDWSDAEILSALMSTGQRTVLKENGVTPANSFDYGASRIRVNLAAIAGLILDEPAANFQAADPALGGDPKTLNLASMLDSNCRLKCSWQRTVKATTSATWTASTSGDMSVSVEPASFTLAAGESQTITVTADVSGLSFGPWNFAALTLTPDVTGVPATTLPVVVSAAEARLELQSATLDDVGASCDNDGFLDDGETGTLTLTFYNNSGVTLANSTLDIGPTNSAVSLPDGASVALPGFDPYQSVTLTARVKLGAVTGIQELPFDLTWDDMSGPQSGSVSFAGNVEGSATDNVESNYSLWIQGGTPAASGAWSRQAAALDAHYWHGPNPSSTSDSTLTSPPLQVSASGDFSFTFLSRFDFEFDGTYWDGGVIEISTDGGNTWTDIGASASPGYNGIIGSGYGNPLAGRLAFGGRSAGYPAFETVTVTLGTAYQGQTVQVRFRIGTDEIVGAGGWDIDDIAFTGIDNTPFATLIVDPPGCSTGNLTYTLSVDAAGNGSGVVNGAGTYNYGDTATVSATANIGSTFAGWGGPDAVACDSGSVAMDADKSCTATFTLDTHTLSVNTAGNGSGTVTGAGSYNYGDTATVTAIANTGSTFTGWSGTDGTECSTGSVAVTADKSCTATFTLDTHTLSVNTAGNGSGTVTGAGSYNYGDTATVTATANTGSTFIGWSGPDATACTSGSVAMDADKSCTATFTLNSYTLSINTVGTGSGTVTGDGTYNYGSSISVTAVPGANSTFAGWSGADGTECDTGSVTITADKVCTATFKATLTVTAQDQSKRYLDPNPVLSYDITGFQQGESASAVSGTPNCTTTALQTSQIGSYPITCTEDTLSTADYTFVFVPGTLTILTRDALVNYIGQTTWTTSGTSSTTAKVTLTASVQDPTTTGLVNAKMNFKDLNTGKYLATGVLVAPVANSPGTGTANTVVTLSSGQYGAESYVILVEMTGDYTNVDQSAQDKTAVIAVAKPSTSNTTIGIGSMVSLPAAAGTYQGNGGDIGYTIGMKYNKSGTKLQGKITVSVPQDDGVLWIKSNAISSMTIVKNSSPKTSSIYTKSTVYKVTPSGVETIDGNVTLRIDSEDGVPDKVGVTVLSSKDSTLYYSNQWLLVPGSNGGQSVWKTVPQAVKVALPTTNSMVTIK